MKILYLIQKKKKTTLVVISLGKAKPKFCNPDYYLQLSLYVKSFEVSLQRDDIVRFKSRRRVIEFLDHLYSYPEQFLFFFFTIYQRK